MSGGRAAAQGGRGSGRGAGGSGKVLTIDVAHPPMSSDGAEAALDGALRSALLGGRVRAVRIIHGYGSGGKGGVLKTAVRNWAFRRRDRIAAIIPGEEYSPVEPRVVNLLREEGISIPELGTADPGVTLLLLG